MMQDHFTPKKLLVTGGAGFIGSNFVHMALSHFKDTDFITLDLLTYAGNLANLAHLPSEQRHRFVRGDIRDRELISDLIKQENIDAIINFAAESNVDRSILGPEPFMNTNILGVFNLLEAARQVWLRQDQSSARQRRFIHISTDEVYGQLDSFESAANEKQRYAPNSPYAASKAAADHLVSAFHATYGLPTIICHCSNNYGPRQYPEKLIPLMITNARSGQPLPIYGDGQQIRDWLFVEDQCQALITVLSLGRIGQRYNIGGGNQWKNLDLVKLLCSILDDQLPNSPHRPHEHLISHVADRPGHDRRYALDSTKIMQELGWSPSVELKEGLRRTILWYLENESWLDEIRQSPNYNSWVKTNYKQRGR